MQKPSTQFKSKNKKDFGHEKLEILYQDQWLVIVNKPSGMLSVPYPGSRARTAQNVLEEIFRKKGELNSKHKPLCVHRLDRDTSGVLMFALTEKVQKQVMDTWQTMVTSRKYHAVAENPSFFLKNKKGLQPLSDSGLINLPLAFNAHNVGYVPNKNEEKVETVEARTNYKKIAEGPTHTLFELELDTGKKNQIRAHLSHFGYPLAGDENYRAKSDPFGRLCLHARTLEFEHPVTGEKMKFEVPEDEAWEKYVIKGDLHPKTAIWNESEKNLHKMGIETRKSSELPKDLKKRVTRKEAAHSNFIEMGKKR